MPPLASGVTQNSVFTRSRWALPLRGVALPYRILGLGQGGLGHVGIVVALSLLLLPIPLLTVLLVRIDVLLGEGDDCGRAAKHTEARAPIDDL